MTLTPFHIAFPVDDLDAARTFYGTTLGCPEGRSSSQWIDFDLFGHQIVAHLKPGSSNGKAHHNAVDGHDVPVPHFGVVLPMETWQILAERLQRAGVAFVIEPYIRFKGEVDNHDCVLLYDADQQHDADDSDHVEILAGDHQREQCADPGRGQRGEDGDRVDVALVEHAQHDINCDERRN